VSLTYPANRLGWMHQFCSLLNRAEVARQIGRDAMLLILAIAVQEDALKYCSAPIFFDSELQRLTGIRSLKHLDRIRQKAIDAGWLVVARSSDGDPMVAQYWTLIPKRLNVFDDSANVGAISATTETPHRPEVYGNDSNVGQAVASQVCNVQEGVASGESGPTADRCSSEALRPCVGPPADAELEARVGSAGASPSHFPGNVNLSTPAAESLNHKPAVNMPAVTVLAATRRDPGISVVAPVAVVAQTSCPSIALSTVLKRLSEYPALIRQQAGDLLTAYPSIRDLEQGLLSICRALEKIPYSQLLPLVNRYSVARNRPGQDLRLTPSAAKWFDEERWREGPFKWEIRDKDLVKKKT
jgi:hypothetical protein